MLANPLFSFPKTWPEEKYGETADAIYEVFGNLMVRAGAAIEQDEAGVLALRGEFKVHRKMLQSPRRTIGIFQLGMNSPAPKTYLLPEKLEQDGPEGPPCSAW